MLTACCSSELLLQGQSPARGQTLFVIIEPREGEPFHAVVTSHDADGIVYLPWDDGAEAATGGPVRMAFEAIGAICLE